MAEVLLFRSIKKSGSTNGSRLVSKTLGGKDEQ